MKKQLQDLLIIQENYPLLTFQNNGFEYIGESILNSHGTIIQQIKEIMISYIDSSFVKFLNFRVHSNNDILIRYDCHYDKTFIGVHYLNLNELIRKL